MDDYTESNRLPQAEVLERRSLPSRQLFAPAARSWLEPEIVYICIGRSIAEIVKQRVFRVKVFIENDAKRIDRADG